MSKNAKIINGDIFKQNLSNATVVNVYLLPETNERLKSKLSKELNKGTRVVGTAFEFKGWKVKKIDPRGPIYCPLYLYKR